MGSQQNGNSSVRVAVRIRPLSAKEIGTDTCVHVLPQEAGTSRLNSSPHFQTIQVGENELSQKFTFDHVFPPTTNQKEFYSICVLSLVHSCLEGYNATIFAYGQTGSGKTHTMMGDIGPHDDEAGVILRASEDIFLGLEQRAESQNLQASSARSPQSDTVHSKYSSLVPPSSKPSFEYQVKVQFIEIYGEEIHDLVVEEFSDQTQSFYREVSVKRHLSRQRSTVKKTRQLVIHDGKAGEDAEVIGACQAKVQSSEEALKYLQRGMKMRRTEQTAMNAESSRSHAIFTLVIQQTQRKSSTEAGDVIKMEMKTSKIHFVDLAGSERIKSTQARGKRIQEGININKGLFVLGNVISSLSNESKRNKIHVPYRDSKLTRLLKGSLGGNHRTLMIGCSSPSNYNKNETLNTLRYANRAKNIQNHARVNIDASSRVINELKDKVTTLAMELLRVQSMDRSDDSECPFSKEFLVDLIRASGTSSKLLSTRPSTAPDLTVTSPLPIQRERSQSDIDIGNTQQLPTKLYELPEELIEGSKIIDTFRNGDAGRDEQSAMYNLVCSSVRDLPPIGYIEGGVVEIGDVDIKLHKCRRLAWHESVEMATRDNEELGDDESVEFEISDYEVNESKTIALYDTMHASMRDVLDGVRNIYDTENLQPHVSNNSDPTQRAEEQDEYSPHKHSGDGKELEKTIDFDTNENKAIVQHDYMQGALKVIDGINIIQPHGSNNPNSTHKVKVKHEYSPYKRNNESEELEKIRHVEMKDYKTIIPYDSVHAPIEDIHVVRNTKNIEIIQLRIGDSPNSTTKVEVKDKCSPHKRRDLTDTYIGNVDKCFHPNVNRDRIISEYRNGYEELKLDNEIKVIKYKIKNYTDEKKYLDDIVKRLGQESVQSIEVENCVSVTEESIAKLQKKLNALLGLPNARFQARQIRSFFMYLVVFISLLILR